MSSGYAFDLGPYRRRTATGSADAQAWFDRGLIWSYAFNHEEAIRCFRSALEADPGFGLALWGVAYAIGPNYNKPWEMFDEADLGASLRVAHESLERAHELAADAPAVERDLIAALRHRHPSAQPATDLEDWSGAYADAMAGVYERHGEDLDVAALYADALMNLTAWQLWDLPTGRPAEGARTLEARAVLEAALALPGGMEHPGLLHLSIHLLEMSPRPEDALPAANALRGRAPDAGHLIHMPTHIDVLCGDYEAVMRDNALAVAADDRYAEHAGTVNFHALYRAHDQHFRVYGAMFAGNQAVALEAAASLAAALPPTLLRIEAPPMADWLEGFVPMNVHVLIRFGRWDELIALPLPEDLDLYCTTTAMTHYGRGVALAATGRVEEADREREAFRAAVARVPDSRYLFNNTCQDILAIASAMLDGEVEYRRGAYDEAFAHLRRSIELDDTLPYDEPWGWMQPTRHAYGALLLEQGHVEEAAAVYAADLGLDETLPRACRHPNNVWALHGHHECLVRLGRREEAAAAKARLDAARVKADVPIVSSCFCRMEVAA